MQTYGNQHYKNIDIATADRGKLVVLLYEGAIDFLNKAKNSALKKDFEGKCNNINRAQDIIQELNTSLKMDEGGDVAKNLRSLYVFMEKHILRAKIEKDGTKKIDEVIFLLTNLYKAWQDILNKPELKGIKNVDHHSNNPGLSRGFSV